MSVDEAKKVLEKNGYFVGSLWNVDDIMNRFHCTEEQAMKVLEDTFNGEYLCGEINESITIVAEIHGLIEKEDEE